MLTLLQAVILGLLQGVTELFPISSLGHSVILPSLLRWQVNQEDPFFVSFLVATHFATAVVLLCFFWKEWLQIVQAFFKSIQNRNEININPTARLSLLIIVSTIPAGLLGLLFEKHIRELLASPKIAAFFLIINGGLLLGAEMLRRKAGTRIVTTSPSTLTWIQATKIGCMQCLALIPGLSRTGASLSGGLLVGLTHEDAAHYSFLLATPIIFAAALLKLPKLFLVGSGDAINTLLIGALASGLAAYFSVRFLTRYFKTRTLIPFCLYCVLFGCVSLFVV